MDRWRGRVAVVTGASAGIGASIVSQLQDAGVEVVALARREDKIASAVENARKEAGSRGRHVRDKAPNPGKLHSVKCDVSKEDDIIKAFKWVKDNTKGVDILINNAGVVSAALLSNGTTDEFKKVLDTNVLGLTICTREAIQQMKARGVDDGHIIHVGSDLGHANPHSERAVMYVASKHAVRILTEGLRKELVAAKSKIRVTEMCPGLTKTDILNDIKLMDPKEVWKRKHAFPEDIADAVLYVLGVPSHVQIHNMIVRAVGQDV